MPNKHPNNRGLTFPPEPLTPSEVIALLESCSLKSSTGIRNRALIATFWRTGIRCSEALSLFPKDIDFDLGTLTVLRGKGAKHRVIGVDQVTLGIIQTWLERRSRLGFTWRNRLFCTLKGTPVDPSYIRRMLPHQAIKAGIQKRVHAHGLRHTLTAELARESTDITIIRDHLGHSNISTTNTYMTKVAPMRVVQAIQKRPWPELPAGVDSDQKGDQ
jgi:site-specific recombinase XerD